MPRSRIPIIQNRAKEIIAELKKNKDVLDIVLDEFVPIDDANAEPARAPEPQVKTTRTRRCAKCEKLSTDPVHDPKSIGTSEFHEFEPRKRQPKKGLPAATHGSEPDPDPGEQPDSETCAHCQFGPDDNIHHKRSMEGYHEFKEAT